MHRSLLLFVAGLTCAAVVAFPASADARCPGPGEPYYGESCYADGDGDGFGDSSNTTNCVQLDGSCLSGVRNDTDCDDSDSSINPGETEHCGNGVDDDCNGDVDGADDACECTNGETKSCYTGPEATAGVGPCQEGVRTCASGTFGDCQNEVVPSDEICNGMDEDCDGTADNQVTDCEAGEMCVSGTCTPEMTADAGTDAGTDAGNDSTDATGDVSTSNPDTGTDGSTNTDSGTSDGDAVTTLDTSDASESLPSLEPTGCGCINSPHHPPATPLALLTLAGLALLRRRR